MVVPRILDVTNMVEAFSNLAKRALGAFSEASWAEVCHGTTGASTEHPNKLPRLCSQRSTRGHAKERPRPLPLPGSTKPLASNLNEARHHKATLQRRPRRQKEE